VLGAVNAHRYRGGDPNSGADIFRDYVAGISDAALLGNRNYCCPFAIAGPESASIIGKKHVEEVTSGRLVSRSLS
jgi:hypothetical protein